MSAEDRRALRKRALAKMRERHRAGWTLWRGLCQNAVRTALEAPGGAASAKAAWQAAPSSHKAWEHDRTPPAGVPVYFKMNTPYWHVALSAGKGNIWSNDILRTGAIDKVSIAYLERHWHAEYLGGLTHVNGKRVW